MSWGTIDSRDGGGMQWSSEKQSLVLPSTIQNLKNLEGFLKFPEYPQCKIKLDIQSYPDISPGFEVGQSFMLDSVHKLGENDDAEQETGHVDAMVKEDSSKEDHPEAQTPKEPDIKERLPQPQDPNIYRDCS
jgi:hypothetical protein